MSESVTIQMAPHWVDWNFSCSTNQTYVATDVSSLDRTSRPPISTDESSTLKSKILVYSKIILMSLQHSPSQKLTSGCFPPA